MVRLGQLFISNCRKLIFNDVHVRKAACCSMCKRYKSDTGKPVEPPEPEHPVFKTIRILKNDLKRVKSVFSSEEQEQDDSSEQKFLSSHCDVLVIGGGAVGSSIAYWLKQRAPQGLHVVVVEKDPSYSCASTVLSVGGLRQQFSLKENIEMSLFGAQFIRNIKRHLSVEGADPPDVQFVPNGYLFLATEDGAEQLQKNADFQWSLGVKNELLSPNKLKQKFPWINTEGVALGCHGLENEGWLDPWALLHAFKRKAISLGTEYIDAEAVGFEFKEMRDMFISGVEPGSYEAVDKLLVRTQTGEIHSIKFGIAVIAAGAFSTDVAKMARIGSGPGFLSIPLPVEPRKRYVYCFHCPDGPGLNMPFVIDSTGIWCRREGLGGRYIAGRCPKPEEEPSVENLDVDYDFFDKNIWPVLASRVPAFESIKVRSAWSGYYEYNTFDQNGIVGPHPYYHNLYIATGFSGHGFQQSPAVGRAVMEMILDGGFETIDLTRLGFDRLITNERMLEQNIW
ncbi:FAD-dependent oxidoreductase domain-containing protein 1 isoform X2 [Anabrus simplex]|uniref:FAD-dependent oxidoreductase domain-containing protein 1 isoform X2 n=1 Tax=Anabrus simplex TaxID=316456 RepID=UPI0035A278F8